jgi:hypothetical protein
MPDDDARRGKADFEPFELIDGAGWGVLVTFPDGHTRNIHGFRSEVAARDWIERHAGDWLGRLRSERGKA